MMIPDRTRNRWRTSLMPCIMLIVFALASCGITTTLTPTSAANENQTQAEELKEHLTCPSQRRACSRGATGERAPSNSADRDVQKRPRLNQHGRRAIVGHRLSNGTLAPVRC